MILFDQDASLTVVGGVSVDTVKLGGRRRRVAGGAGLYAALAARRAGLSSVTMIGPRPVPAPAELEIVAGSLEWLGPEVGIDGVPYFEIEYDTDGRRQLRIVSRGREAELSAEQFLPGLGAGPVYVTPITSSRSQLDVVRRLKAAGRWVAAGTYPCAAREETGVVREVFETSDAFFCNEEEAISLFGTLNDARTAPGKTLFVSRGRSGVRVLQGSYASDVQPVAVEEVDPTGAGDAMCGAALAALIGGEHPVRAARFGAAMAARVVSDVGPEALLTESPPPPYPVDPRLDLDRERIARVAEWLAESPHVAGFDFCGDVFPPPGDEGALDFFFSQTLQQFGFWLDDGRRYQRPMVASLGGQERKGSDYLWAVYHRWLLEDRKGLSPRRQKRLGRQEFDSRYRSDAGVNPVPAAELHWRLARSYGSDLEALGTSPAQLVDVANRRRKPVTAMLQLLDHVGGYKEDPLRKKSALLALVLRQRPEQFLRREPRDDVPPIVDYHLQRSCLRIGLVTVGDRALEASLKARQVLDSGDESAVREACYRAIDGVKQASGRPMAEVDWFFFQNRRRCPEMTRPECARCELETVCAQRTELFQPVRRTTFY